MSLPSIRAAYGVPAKRGMRVLYTGGYPIIQQGVIVSSRGAYLRVRMDGCKSARTFHPRWRIRYLTPETAPC
ncbi:hypothetical protein [Nevskia ramosa]|uniref:hypothetical protein n=1 Tax=Nevskia ramosa TaxID=64002 RepID=UPI003D0DEF12